MKLLLPIAHTPNIRYTFLTVALVVVACVIGTARGEEEAAAAAEASVAEESAEVSSSSSSKPPPPPKQERIVAKDWYLEKIKIAGVELPFNIVTLVIVVVSAYVLFTGLFAEDPTKPKCTASHILIDNSTDATKTKMEELKKKIGSDKEAFAKCASDNSTCPSKAKGGE